MTYPSDDLNRLIQLGRQRGALTVDDLRHTMPLDQMSAEDVADVIARLEAAGVAVELDPALLVPNRHDGVRLEALPASFRLRSAAGPEAAPAALAHTALARTQMSAPSPESTPLAPVTWSRAALTMIVAALVAAGLVVAWVAWRLA